MKIFLSIIKNRKFYMVIILSILLFFYTTICAISYANNISTDLSNNLLRLHVIANSDSIQDQTLKYIIRDNLLNYMNNICKDCQTKQEAIIIVEKNINEFEKIALNTIKENGFNYTVSIKIGEFQFPTKTYGDISLPAGFYDALRVEIGEAHGQNWWCVMFPPLCFVDVSTGIVPNESKELMKDNLSEEEFALVSDTPDNSIKFKFKLLEFFANNGLITAKK